MFGIGTQELVIIFLIVLVLFGPKALPQLGKAIGGGIRELKKSMSSAEEVVDEIKLAAHSDKPQEKATIDSDSAKS